MNVTTMMGDVSESAGTATATISTGTMPTGNIVARWRTVPLTATEGTDYTAASGTVTLTPMMYFTSVSTTALADAVTDPGETFQIEVYEILSGAATIGSAATFTITDSTIGGGGPQPTSVSVASPGTLNEGQTFNLHVTFSPPGMYQVSGTVNWGASPGMGSATFDTFTMYDGSLWLAHTYYDDGPAPGNGTASDQATITVNATSAALVGSTTATINNIAPTGLNSQGQTTFALTNDFLLGGPTWKVTGELRDAPLHGDLIDVTIDWGDGSPNTVLNDLPSPAMISQEHIFPPTGQSYTVTVTATDDDTGSYVWSKALEMYLLDLDNDADNDGAIEVEDDALEAEAPGRVMTVNDDDDNGNQIPDGQETQSVGGEDDLKPFNLAFSPALRPEINSYQGWSVALTHPTGASVWTSSDKASRIEFTTQTTIGLAKVWVVGSDPIPATLYIEATQAGVFGLSLHILNLAGQSADSDTVTFEAAAVAVQWLEVQAHGWEVDALYVAIGADSTGAAIVYYDLDFLSDGSFEIVGLAHEYRHRGASQLSVPLGVLGAAPDLGDYALTIRANLDNGQSDEHQTIVEYLDTPPDVDVTLIVESEQDGPFEAAISIQLFGDDSIATADIDWGDGTTQIAAPGEVVFSHTYAANGTYSISVDVTDSDGQYTFGPLELSGSRIDPFTQNVPNPAALYNKVMEQLAKKQVKKFTDQLVVKSISEHAGLSGFKNGIIEYKSTAVQPYGYDLGAVSRWETRERARMGDGFDVTFETKAYCVYHVIPAYTVPGTLSKTGLVTYRIHVFETVTVKNKATGNTTVQRRNIFSTLLNTGEDKKWAQANSLTLDPNPGQLPNELP